jgi:hypothetical protein
LQIRFDEQSFSKMGRNLLYLLFSLFITSCAKDVVVPNYNLNVDVIPTAGGSVTPAVGTFKSGEKVELLAKPASEYLFKEWRGGLTGQMNPAELIMNGEKMVTGVFQKRTYPLSLQIEGQGVVDESILVVAPDGRTTDYPSGTTVRLLAKPVEGWTFKGWAGDVNGSTNPLDLKVDKGVSLKAVFEKAYFKLNLVLSEGGSLEIKSDKTNETRVIQQSQSLDFEFGEKLTISAKPASSFLFDGWAGIISDRVNLIESQSITITKNSDLSVFFAKMNSGKKLIRNEFSDETMLNFRSGDNFIVWWDKRYNQNHKAKDVLKWAELTWQKSLSWGMEPPVGSDKYFINIYLHLKGNEGAGVDVFNDDWGQGVGTDRFGSPFYTAPVNTARFPIYEDFCTIGNVPHECFHLMQYKGSNTYKTFNYSEIDNRWYIEASANWFEATSTKINPLTNPSGTYDSVPSYLFQPQLALWSFGYQTNGAMTWSRAVHGYGAQIFLLYLTWNKIVSDDFFGKSFYSKSSLSPQEYIYQNIPDFENVFRNFALNIVVKDKIPAADAAAIVKREEDWLKNFATRGNAKANGENDDNRYAFKLKDEGTNGLVSPAEKPQAWSYSVAKLESTAAQNYRVDFVGDAKGNMGTVSNFYLGYVIDQAGKYTYSNVPLTNSSGSKEISVPAGSIVYFVTVSTPRIFGGNEEFNYKINLVKK